MRKNFFGIPKNNMLWNKQHVICSTNSSLSNIQIKKRRLFQIIQSHNENVNYSSQMPKESVFLNFSFDKGRLKNVVLWFLKNYGQNRTIFLLEHLKEIGFGYATKAGISLGIDDLKIPPQKISLLQNAQHKIVEGEIQYKRGEITGVERFQRLIDTWHQTSESLKQEVIRHFEATDLLNPVYMMAFSGARGNISQVRQLVGMRGLMADPQGKILDFPIRSNFREGLTLTEYVISTYGARKGIVDTALRTANAGYLTRRLVDVAQHVIVAELDCGTKKGIYVFDMKEGTKTIYSLANRLVGRVLAKDIVNSNNETIALKNQEIYADLASSISKITKKALIRSPLTCETKKLVCQLCYGWSLSNNSLVSIGESVGIIAAQSIGEPGTQLTMRTFHTGGVFAGGLSDQIIAQYDGIVEYSHSIPGLCIRTPQGQIAFLTKTQGSLIVKEFNSGDEINLKTQMFHIPPYTLLFKRNGEKAFKKQIIGQISSISTLKTQRGDDEQTIYSEFEGQVYNSHIDVIGKINESNDITFEAWGWGYLWILAGKIYQCPLESFMVAFPTDFVNENTVLNRINWVLPQKANVQIKNQNTNLLNQQKLKSLFLAKSTLKNEKANASRFQSGFFISSSIKQKKRDKKTNYNFYKYSNNSNYLLEKNKKFILSKKIKTISSSLISFQEKETNTKKSRNGQKNFLISRVFQNSNLNKNFMYHSKICSNRFIKIKFNPKQLNNLNYKLYDLTLGINVKKKHYFNYPFQFLIKNLINESFNHKKLQLNAVQSTNFRFQTKENKQFLLLSQVYHFNKWTLINLIHKVVTKKVIKTKISSKFEIQNNQSILNNKWQNKILKRQNSNVLFSISNFFWSLKMFQNKFTKLPKTKGFKKVGNKYSLKAIENSVRLKSNIQKLPKNSKIQKFKKILNKIKKKNQLIPLKVQKIQKRRFFNHTIVIVKTINLNKSNFSQIIYNNNLLNAQKVSSLKEQQKSQMCQLFLTQPVIFFNFKNLSYKKFGYNFSVKSEFNSDKFFVLNSITNPVLNSKKQNTYQWSPVSKLFFKWLPKSCYIYTNGVFSFHFIKPNPISLPKNVKTRKSLLFVLNFFYREKNKFFLSYYQSPVQRYLTTKKKLIYKQKKKTCIYTFAQNKVLLHSIKNLKSSNIQKISFQKVENLNKLNINNPYYLTYSPTLSFKKDYLSFKKENIVDLYVEATAFSSKEKVKNKIPKNSILTSQIQTKVGFTDIKFEKNTIFKAQQSAVSKFRWKNNNFVKKQENSVKKGRPARFKKQVKTKHFGKNTVYSNLRATSKLSLQDNEIFWIPQEDYQLNSLVHLNSLNPVSPRWTQQGPLPLFYRQNRQGKKESFYPNLNGLVKTFKTNIHLDLNPKSVYKLETKEINVFQNVKSEKQFLMQKSAINLELNFLNFLKTKSNTSFLFKEGLFSKKQLSNKKLSKFLKQSNKNPTSFNYSLPLSLKTQFFKVLKLNQSFSNKNLLFPKANSTNVKQLQTEIVNISVQQGWVYYNNQDTHLLKLHQTFMNSGTRIVDDLVFDTNKTYLSCSFLNKGNFNLSTFSTKLNSLNKKTNTSIHSFNVHSIVKTTKTRYKVNSPLSGNKDSLICLIIQPLHYKILPNRHFFKKQIFKANNKFTQSYFSKFLLQNYYSSNLNKLIETKKLVPSFPNVDLNIFSNFENKKMKKYYKPLVHFKQKSTFFYSAYPLNVLPLNISFSIPTGFSYYFKEPSLTFSSLNTYKVDNFPVSDNYFSNYLVLLNNSLNILLYKQELRVIKRNSKLFKSQGLIKPFKLIYKQLETEKSFFRTHCVNSSSLGRLVGFPCLNFSLSNKMAYFANQKLFQTDLTNEWFNNPLFDVNSGNIPLSNFMKEKVAQETSCFYSDSFSAFPISKNEFLLSSSNLIQPNQPFANTLFLSSVTGELLINSTPQWAFNTDNTRSLFLTASDLLSFSLIKDKNKLFHFELNKTKLTSGVNPSEMSQLLRQANFSKMKKYPNYNSLVTVVKSLNQNFLQTEQSLTQNFDHKKINSVTTLVQYNHKIYKIKNLKIGQVIPYRPLRLGSFLVYGDLITLETGTDQAGQIVHLSSKKITLRYAQPISASPKGILHAYNGDFVSKNAPVITLPFQTLKTGDIVQGIPKVEQYFEARTTKRGRLFRDSLPNLLQGIFERYCSFLPLEIAVQQSLLKIQQILVDGVQRVYRSQGVSIADKHLEVIIRQMTRKVLIVNGGQTGFFAGELVDLELIEKVNPFLLCKINYEPVILGITRASLEVDSFLSAASFQQTTKILSRAAIYKKKDFLKGLKENIIVGNLIPSGTGYLVHLQDLEKQSNVE